MESLLLKAANGEYTGRPEKNYIQHFLSTKIVKNIQV